MDFPIVDVFDDALSEAWLQKHFHPQGLQCPSCGVTVKEARRFRRAKRSRVTIQRCRNCETIYNVYSGTIFAGKQLRPAQALLLLRGVCKGETTACLARELGLAYDTVHHLRQQIQVRAVQAQPRTPLPDVVAETDEMFQNAGEKRRKARGST